MTLYKIHSGFANVADDWSLDEADANEFRGDYSQEFALPNCVTQSKTIFGSPALFDAEGEYVHVSINKSGQPIVLVGFDWHALEAA
ncbi:hypothetical protein HFN59_02450 [Rhizobium leguminosarum]|uniref:hypothetical protein n=1 Tax=Rhizobium leguminosarum TaxID=384 RepID=UPI001C97C2BF|nr:hypothetical protein [Rhizobium leguminosarum]MBY5775985.1 hypothetical protein [Rhizobium leguminosarum]